MVPQEQSVPAAASWPNIDLRGHNKVVVGRSTACNVALGHPSVSAKHASFHVLPTGVEIEDLDSKFGTTVNGVRVRRTQLKSGDLVRFGDGGVAYRFFGVGLRVDPESHGLAVRMDNVGFAVSNRQLLTGIKLEIVADSFVGILGPSGTGKSLLLGCLATTLKPSAGQITFDDGQPLSGEPLEYYRSRLGLVPQEDLVYAALTVRENVRFAAELRLLAVPRQQLEQTIDTVLHDVAMVEHQDKLASILSGGQRKRLSVAIELLLRPRLLVLDEPTSGLDPGMQANLMDRLRGLARQGITVVTSSHTLDTLHYFDSVIVLARRGRSTTCIFHGPPAGLLPAFNKRDLADLFDYLSCENESESPVSGSTLPPSMGNQARLGSAARSRSAGRMSLPSKAEGGKPRDVARVVRQAEVVARRSWLTFRRDSMALRLAMCQPFLLASLIVFSQLKPAQSVFIHAFLVIAAIWLGMTVTVREMVRERALFLRDRLAGLSPDGYWLGKILFAAGVTAAQCLVLFAAARLLIALPPLDINDFARDLLQDTNLVLGSVVMILAGLGGTFIGMTVSSLSRTEQAAVAMLPLLILPQLLFSRTSAGEGTNNWGANSTSAYSPIAIIGQGAHDNRAQFYASLPMLSRPATAAIDMLPYHRIKISDPPNPKYVELHWLCWEWLYLLTLVALLGTTCYIVFRLCEKHWHSSR